MKARYYIHILLRLLKSRVRLLSKNKASPLVEEGLLIGLAIMIFIVIATILSGVIDWVNQLANSLPG